MDAGQAPDVKIPKRGTTPALGVCMFMVAVAASTFVPETRAAAPDFNGTQTVDPHAVLFREARLAMEQREGWQRPTDKGRGVSVPVNLASDAAPELGTLLGLPPGSTWGCAGGGGARCGTKSSGDGGAGAASYTRCTAPGCDWKTKGHKSTLLKHWEKKHRDIDMGSHPCQGCETSEAEVRTLPTHTTFVRTHLP